MLHQVGVSFDLYYDARKHKIKIKQQQFDIPEYIPVKELSSIVFITWSTGCRIRKVIRDRIEEQNIFPILISVTVLISNLDFL